MLKQNDLHTVTVTSWYPTIRPQITMGSTPIRGSLYVLNKIVVGYEDFLKRTYNRNHSKWINGL